MKNTTICDKFYELDDIAHVLMYWGMSWSKREKVLRKFKLGVEKLLKELEDIEKIKKYYESDAFDPIDERDQKLEAGCFRHVLRSCKITP